MPPENPAQQKSEDLQKTSKALEDRVDKLEPPEVKNSKEDWSERVRKEIERGERRIRRTVEKLAKYLPDPERFLKEKLEAYQKEIEAITAKLSLEKNIDIEALSTGLGEADEKSEKLNHEEQLAEAKRRVSEDPISIVRDADYTYASYKKLLTENEKEVLLQEAVTKCVDSEMEYVLYGYYQDLQGKPFFNQEVERAWQNLLKKNDKAKLFGFIFEMEEKKNGFMKRPDVAALLPELFKVSFFDLKNLFYWEIAYTSCEKEPWFENAFKSAFEKTAHDSPKDMFHALAWFKKNMPNVIDKPYIKTGIRRLTEEMIKKDSAFAVLKCDLFRGVYSEPEWKNLLKAAIENLKGFEIERMSSTFEFLKTLPRDLLEDFAYAASIRAPGVILSNYQDLRGALDNNKWMFTVAVDFLQDTKPGLILESLYNDRDKKLPFANRDDTARSAALTASNYNPTWAVRYHSVYENLPDAPKIFEIAKKRTFIAENLRLGWRQGMDNLSINESEGALFYDPALSFIDKIDRDWFPPNLNDHEFAQMAVAVARNLYLSHNSARLHEGGGAPEKACKTEYEKIMDARKKYKEMPVFADRNVIVASHIESYSDSTDRFGRKALIDAIEQQQGKGKKMAHFEAKGNTIVALKQAKQDILHEIETMEGPMTFVFDGHGGTDALYLSDGQIAGMEAADKNAIIETEKTMKITVDEFAAALARRSEKMGKEKVKEDILVFAGCYNHTFLRMVYEKLTINGAGKPIALGMSEFGQVGFSDRRSPYGNVFFDRLLQNGKKPTLGDIWNMETFHAMDPSLYIPFGDIEQQIAEKEALNRSDS